MVEKTPIDQLRLQGHAGNLNRSLRRAANAKPLAHRSDLEALYEDAKALYESSMDDVRVRGSVITTTKYSSKGIAYDLEVVNPNFRVAAKAHEQLSHLATLLSKTPKTESEKLSEMFRAPKSEAS